MDGQNFSLDRKIFHINLEYLEPIVRRWCRLLIACRLRYYLEAKKHARVTVLLDPTRPTMALSCHIARHFSGTARTAPVLEPDPRTCLVVATAVPPADGSWSKEAVEDTLEEIASLLEGEEDQDLVIRGVGEDGDIRLDLVEVEAHESLRDQRSWLRTGFPPPPRRHEIVLNLTIEGGQDDVQQAAAELLRELGHWVAVRRVTMSWSPTVAAAPGWACASDHGALDLG
jgi:hypothetical protein